MLPKWQLVHYATFCRPAECEPYLTCDYRAMVEKETTDKLVTGVQICMKVLGVKKAFNDEPINSPNWSTAKIRILQLPKSEYWWW